MSTALRIFFKKFFGIYAVIFLGIRTNAISPPTQYIYNIPKGSDLFGFEHIVSPSATGCGKKSGKTDLPPHSDCAKLTAVICGGGIPNMDKPNKTDNAEQPAETADTEGGLTAENRAADAKKLRLHTLQPCAAVFTPAAKLQKA